MSLEIAYPFSMKSKNLNRSAFKLVHNLKSLLFLLSYYGLEVPWNAYNKYIQKRSIKALRINYPIIDLIRFKGVEFLIYFESKGIIEELILKEGSYEGELLAIADRFIKKNTIIIDVGANIGFESLYFAKKYPANLVYSYEPTSIPFNCLSKSKDLNGLENLKIFKLGVGEKSGMVTIHAATNETYNKGLASIESNFDLDDTFTKETIDIITLDEHVTENMPVSLIKIDVQGYEIKVLEGAITLIEKDRPVIIYEHFEGYYSNPQELRDKIENLLFSLGYELYIIRSKNTFRPHKFLEKVDLKSRKEINGDIVALPLRSVACDAV
jgi:FkbM family methyltransferase